MIRLVLESQVTIKTLVQSETISKTKIPSFLCKSSLVELFRANKEDYMHFLLNLERLKQNHSKISESF